MIICISTYFILEMHFFMTVPIAELGIDEIALADSTGMAKQNSIQEISTQVMNLAGGLPVFLHLHDTEGKGLANALATLQVGVSHFDTAFGGMGAARLSGAHRAKWASNAASISTKPPLPASRWRTFLPSSFPAKCTENWTEKISKLSAISEKTGKMTD